MLCIFRKSLAHSCDLSLTDLSNKYDGELSKTQTAPPLSLYTEYNSNDQNYIIRRELQLVTVFSGTFNNIIIVFCH